MAALLRGLSSKFTPTQSTVDLSGFKTAKNTELFPKTDPAVDGEECLHDCESCTVKYPKKWSVDEDEKLYGHINGWSTHLLVGTGKDDWVRDVQDEKGSVMEAVGKSDVKPSNGKMMLSASNMPIPHESHHDEPGKVRTTVLLLPSFKYIDHVTPAAVPDLIQHCINSSSTNTTPLASLQSPSSNGVTNGSASQQDEPTLPQALPHGLSIRDCPHAYLILVCSQGTRDARCGQSAPLLRKEFARHLRPLGLYRDLEDERPGGVGIYYISHVGGHKFAANVMIYRRGSAERESTGVDGTGASEAAQCIWLARVRPEDCENIVRYTILQGKLVKPERQLRGGFDRSRQLVSW